MSRLFASGSQCGTQPALPGVASGKCTGLGDGSRGSKLSDLDFAVGVDLPFNPANLNEKSQTKTNQS